MLDIHQPFLPLIDLKGQTKMLHVQVPEAAHMQARMAAIASRVPFKTFMAHLMLSATPLEAPASVGDAASDFVFDSHPNSLNSLKG